MSGTFLDDLNTMRKEIEAVKEQEIVEIDMPILHFTTEARLAQKRFQKFHDRLKAGKMDIAKEQKIDAMIGALRQLQTDFLSIQFPDKISQQKWAAKRDEADELLYDIKCACDLAFRSTPSLQAQVSRIRQGASNSDLIQDLNDIATLCKANVVMFSTMDYDTGNFELAAKLAKELDDLLAQATLDRSSSPELRIVRDKSYTLLKNTLADLNAQARFIFRKEREIAESFYINPPRRKARKMSIEQADTVTA